MNSVTPINRWFFIIVLFVILIFNSACSRGQEFDRISQATINPGDDIPPPAGPVVLTVSGDIDAALVIPPGFANTVHSGQPAQVQAILDGTDPFAGAQIVGSLTARSGTFVASTGASRLALRGQLVEIRTQAWYNADLKSMNSMVPGLLAIVLIMPTMALALALTREKETGTLEGLVATPVSGTEYLLGKLLAYIAAGLVSAVDGMVTVRSLPASTKGAWFGRASTWAWWMSSGVTLKGSFHLPFGSLMADEELLPT